MPDQSLEPASQHLEIAEDLNLLEHPRSFDFDVERERQSTLQHARTLLAALRKHNPGMADHSERVGDLAEELGEGLGLSKSETELLRVGGMLHDIGKLFVPNEILDSPGTKLTEKEWEMIHDHTYRGYDILQQSPELTEIASFALLHHENWDGNGYPIGLSGNEIPRLVRIVAVADVWDAVRNDRSYQDAKSVDEAKAVLRESAGIHLDPNLVERFIELIEEKDRISDRHLEQCEVRQSLFHDHKC